jgi:hypothetical protein
MTTDPLSFAKNIKPLFRQRDRDAMLSHFDLWECKDVASHSQAILGAIKAGAMPCDGAWPQEQIALLERWVEQGAAP